MLLPTGVNNRDRLKVLKMLAYVGLLKSSARPDGAAWGKACSRRGELPSAGVQERDERGNWWSSSDNSGITAVPVDLAATRGRGGIIAIIWITESRAKRIDCGLNRDVGLVQRLGPAA